jgi:S1-C subfamily serine protease
MRTISIRSLAVSLSLALLAAPVSAQATRPVSLEDIEGLLKSRVPAARILSRARDRCISFRIDSAADARLKKAGAGAIFIDQLREVCNPDMPKDAAGAAPTSPSISAPSSSVSAPAGIDSSVAVRITAALVGTDLTVRKLPQLDLLVIGPRGDTVRLATDLNGEAAGNFIPGVYRIESAQQVELQGQRYRWGIYVPVQVGMRQVELTQKNATVETLTGATVSLPQSAITSAPGSAPVPTPSETPAAPPVAPAAGAPSRAGRRVSEEAQLFDKYRPGVFTVWGTEGRGTGFYADTNGLVITNAHIVRNSDDIRVKVDSFTTVRARVVAIDPALDIAVLGINRSRCGKCVVLPMFDTATGPLASPGERVMAMGSPYNRTAMLSIGIVNSVDAQSVTSDVSISYLNSGGPLVNLDGNVIAVNTFRDEVRPGEPRISNSLPITAMLGVLSAARDSAASLAVSPPSDTLLPIVPRDPFPVEPITAIAALAEIDTRKYRQDVEDFKLFVMTPQIMGWRQAQAVAKLADMRKKNQAKGVVDDDVDPIQAWRDWDDYLVTRKAVVLFNVTPSSTDFPFYEVDKVVDPEGGSFGDLKLYRDGIEVTPVERIRIPATLSGSARRAAGREIPYQGIYAYRPEDFGPKPDGSQPVFTVSVWDAAKKGKAPAKVPLDKKIVEVALRDFGPYFIGARGR